MMRLSLFAKTESFIIDYMTDSNRTHTVGHNNFSDWTETERKQMLGGKKSEILKNYGSSIYTDLPPIDIPTSVNWIEYGAVNPVQNQGHCGSCWAFSAIASIEGGHFIKTGALESLSVAQCVDCDNDSYGCSGGNQDNCMWYVDDNGGIDFAVDYPYDDTQVGGPCWADWPPANAVTVTNVNYVVNLDESQLLRAIAESVVAITIDAASDLFF